MSVVARKGVTRVFVGHYMYHLDWLVLCVCQLVCMYHQQNL